MLDGEFGSIGTIAPRHFGPNRMHYFAISRQNDLRANMIQIASRSFAFLLALVLFVGAVDPADARSRGKHQAARHHRISGERTATNEKLLNAASDDLDRTINGRIKSICRGC